MIRLLLIYLLVLIGMEKINAQAILQLNSSEILQGLKKLNTVGSVLYIAAHPDDENTRLLAYMSKERNLRTGYLSITRGDGGQNLVGKEQAEMLGLIRTQELLAARRVDGAEQFFTRANDFGYSKNPEETFRFWNKDSVLADVVWVIRNFKPDIIICRFPTTGEGGHGHHTASAILAMEAFSAAADPKKFPEQLKYTQVWQVKRLFWNTFNFGGTNTTSSDQLKIDVGVFNPILGKGYGEIAAESRSMHKSQGFGSAKSRGSTIEYFKQLKGDSVKNDLLEGIDVAWARLKNGAVIQKMISDCIHYYDPQSPGKSITTLMSVLIVIKQLPENDFYTAQWKKIKQKEIESLIANCTGLWMEVSASSFSGIPGRKIEYTAQIIDMGNSEVKLNKITWMSKTDTTISMTLKKNEMNSYKHFEVLASNSSYSNPYWLKMEHSEGLYSVKDQLLIGKPENDPAGKIIFDIAIDGENFQFERPLIYKSTDPVKGEIYRPLEIIPPAAINFSAKAFAFKNSSPEKLQLELISNADSLSGKIRLNLPSGWTANPDTFDFNNMMKGENKFIETMVTPPSKSSDGNIFASIVISGETISKSIRRIEYDHIPCQFMLKDAKAKLVSFDLNPGVKNIGYIPGAGDEVAASLAQIGYNVTELSEESIAHQDLSSFDAIITGIRAYNTNNWLQNEYSKLMDYVKNGGNLIVQYNTNNRIGPLNAKISPYPFTISRERVTDENAEVRFVNPSHSILNFPNKITIDDFKGWKQERGIYFASELDSSYQTIFSMNDQGEKANEGSLVVAKYGKGNFVYTGIVFFRELPAGVQGAYRLFANMMSIPKN